MIFSRQFVADLLMHARQLPSSLYYNVSNMKAPVPAADAIKKINKTMGQFLKISNFSDRGGVFAGQSDRPSHPTLPYSLLLLLLLIIINRNSKSNLLSLKTKAAATKPAKGTIHKLARKKRKIRTNLRTQWLLLPSVEHSSVPYCFTGSTGPWRPII